MMNIKVLYVIALFIAIVLFSCKKEKEISSLEQLNRNIYKLMVEKKNYYWYNEMNKVKPDGRTNSHDYLDALLFKEKDRWSFLIDRKTMDDYYDKGEVFAFGITQKYDSGGILKVASVVKNSPMDKAGVQRGDQLVSINGYSIGYIFNNNMWSYQMGENKNIYTADFVFKKPNGELLNASISKDVVVEKAIDQFSIIEKNNVKAGYLVFNTFISTGVEQLNEAFNHFKNNNIEDLIVDLRYNSGGSLAVAIHFCNLAAGNSRVGKNIFKLQYNEFYTSNNVFYNFDYEPNAIDIKRIVYITSKKSASASESIINGLSPYLDVKLVGDDTYGKPVGMNSFPVSEEYYLVPITFDIANSLNEGNYFDGIPVNQFVEDDLDKDLGDPMENSLKEALHYLEHGRFSSLAKSAKTKSVLRPEEMGEHPFKYVSGNLLSIP